MPQLTTNLDSVSITSPTSTTCFYSSSATSSISSSGPDFRPVYPEMIRNKLKRIFFEPSSLPAKMDTHRLRPAVKEVERVSLLTCQKIPVKKIISSSKHLQDKE